MFAQLKITKQKKSNFNLVNTIIEKNKKSKKHKEILNDLKNVQEKEKLEKWLIQNHFYTIEDFNIINSLHEEYNPNKDCIDVIIDFITGYREIV